jgi:putative membrane protein
MSGLAAFIARLLLSSTGLYVCVWLFGDIAVPPEGLWVFIIAGLIFSLANAVLKPIVTILSLPLILLTLGLFTLIVNGVLVYVAIALTPGLSMPFWGAVWSGIIMSVVNYAIGVLVPAHDSDS